MTNGRGFFLKLYPAKTPKTPVFTGSFPENCGKPCGKCG
jgi:hypothetical protein